uniref:Insulin-like growth factor-binding protein 6 n=1 Tax=Salvator merianae TaxID=96440 RepID=A0A8D0B1G0_SALMN
MLPACWLGGMLLGFLFLSPAAPLTAAGGAASDGYPPAAASCAFLAGCDSPESGDPKKAPCEEEEKGCAGSRASGEPCGVYTPGCARGLRCVPRPGERAPLHALLRGKGVCTAAETAKKGGGGGRNQTEAGPGAGDEGSQAGHATPEPLRLQNQDPLQEATVNKAQLQQSSLSNDAKQELDTGPCRMHLAAILQELKAPLYMNGEDIFIPNCDTKGFYRRKQCRASKGQKRGQCWCVDKRGRRLEGLEENPLCLLANSD